MEWRLLFSDTLDPTVNLAVEEAIVRNRKEGFCKDTFRVWRNNKSVILGCHSDVQNEVNLETCEDLDIQILRRTSGGGAVFHDLGNINFSVIMKDTSKRSTYDVLEIYDHYSEAVVNSLKFLGIEAEFHPPNLILVNGKKVSGMAQHRFYDVILFHGTLLVNSDLKTLSKVLLNPKDEVTNLSFELSRNLPMDEVVEALVNSFRKHLSARAFQFNVEKLDPSEIDIAKELVEVKYCRSQWNFNSDDQILLVKDSARYF